MGPHSLVVTACTLLALTLCLLAPSALAQEPGIQVTLYEGMRCDYGRDCSSATTLMKCLSLNRGPYQCRCEPFRAGANNATQPYFNQEVGKCVVRVGQTCALPAAAGGWEEYDCEPHAQCMPDEQIRDQERYGLCAGAGSVVVQWFAWIIPTLAMWVVLK